MDTLIITLFAIAGTLLTYFSTKRYGWTPVFSSAFWSLVCALFFRLFPDIFNEELSVKIPVVFFGATFIGMISVKKTTSIFALLLATVIFVSIAQNTSSFFKHYGGNLGTTASVSLLMVLASDYFRSDKKISLAMRKMIRKLKSKK